MALNSEMEAAIKVFAAAVESMISAYFAKHYENVKPPAIVVDPNGKKYIRVVRDGGEHNRSVYCFIDASNGDVLKPDGWKRPAKHARGNIFSSRGGLEACGPHGIAYLK